MGKKIAVGILLTGILVIIAAVALRAGGKFLARPETISEGGQEPVVQERQEEESVVQEEETIVQESEPVAAEPEKSEEELLQEQIEATLANMTLEEKVAQLFVVTPEALTGYETVTAAGDATREAIQAYPVGGLIYFQKNLQSPEQVKEMLANTRLYYKEAGCPAPFLSVDEEGGSVSRIAKQSAFGAERMPDMRVIGENGNLKEANRVGTVIGSYLSELGFNLDFAPVADVLTNSENEVVKKRSFGSDPELVAEMSMAVAWGLESQGVYASLKHYPGHGATKSDSHKGYAYTDKTLEELLDAELIPFQKGIEEGIQFIMVAHICVPTITEESIPCSLSKQMITEVLREQLGYEGIVITDALNMGAISQEYSAQEASKKALEAGVDLLLMPADFTSAYEGILTAVESGEITEERIDASVRRILRAKYNKSFFPSHPIG